MASSYSSTENAVPASGGASNVDTNLPYISAASSIRFGLIELETFLAVAELGSFSEAARRLEISQPSATVRVQRLETMLKTRLLKRTTRRVELTDAGSRLQSSASTALAGLRELMRAFELENEKRQQKLVVATTPDMREAMVQPLVDEFAAMHDGATVSVRTVTHDAARLCVEDGLVDVAIISGIRHSRHSRALDFDSLAPEPLGVVVPRNHVLARGKAASTTLLQMTGYSVYFLAQDTAAQSLLAIEWSRRGIAPEQTHVVGDFDELRRELNVGKSIALVRESYAKPEVLPEDFVYLDISDVAWSRSVGILRSRQFETARLTYEFCDFLKQRFHAEDAPAEADMGSVAAGFALGCKETSLEN